jgi:putative transposase
LKENRKKLHGYQTTNRAKHNLKIYLILVCKYRKKLLYGEFDVFLKAIISNIERKSDFNRLKSVTTYHLWQNYIPFLKQHFWKENSFWTDGYFVYSAGEATPETVRRYIQNQGWHLVHIHPNQRLKTIGIYAKPH